MKRWQWLGLASGLLFIPLTALANEATGPDETKAIDAILKLGGKLTTGDPDGAVIEADLSRGKVHDVEAALIHLKGLTNLRALDLIQVHLTGACLKHLGELKGIRNLDLVQTDIGDADLRFLASMVELEHLDLGDTKVGDAGLAYLTGLSSASRNLTFAVPR